jgi:copper chaperone NosL
MTRAAVAVMLACAAAGCATGPAPPADLDTQNDACSVCRMMVSDRRLAAQIASAGQEPRFFDDLGCLASFLNDRPAQGGETVYVADHRTGEWTAATKAIFSRLPRASTPMGSGLIAHTDANSKALDDRAAGSTSVAAELFLRRASAGATPP